VVPSATRGLRLFLSSALPVIGEQRSAAHGKPAALFPALTGYNRRESVVGGEVITTRHRNIALLVAGCSFMEMLDGTIVTTASPQIGRSLRAPAAEIGLVVTAYLLTLAVLIPLSGWLTRRYGNRVVFLTAIALFTLASVGCASSVNLGMLVAMRVVQGTGGAMMVPVGRNMVLSPAAKEDILRLISFVVWPGLLAPVIAPLAGGLITTYATWHWIFLINVPLGVVAFSVAWRLVTAGPSAGGAPPPLDWAGVVLTCAGLGGLTWAAHLVSLSAPPVAETVALFAVSAALLTGALTHLRRAAHPLLNLRTLSVRTFRVSQLGGTMYYFVIGSMPFLLPLMFEVQFGWSPVKSGALTAFVFAGNVGIKPFTTPLINRFGFRPLLIASTLGTAVIVAALGFTTASTPVAVIAVLALASGVTRSAGLTVYSSVGLADMLPELMRDANVLAATSMQLAAGLAIAGATVGLRVGDAVTSGGQAAYTVAFCLMALVAAACAVEALLLDPAAGNAARRARAAGPPAPPASSAPSAPSGRAG
jgi:MFS family permease